MKKNLIQLHTKQRGFILLFTVVVTAIIFLIGAGVFSLSFKELLVSGISRESQKSIFAADSGVECALMADTNGWFTGPGIFGCFGHQIVRRNSELFNLPLDGNTCTTVTHRTEEISQGGSPIMVTTVIAQGYNKCDDEGAPVTGYAGLAERVYKVSF